MLFFDRRHCALLALLAIAGCSSSPGAVALSDDAGDAGAEAGSPETGPGEDATMPTGDAGADVVATFDTGPCSDGVKDGTETDVDCGGQSCAMCQPSMHCKAASDCTSDVCTAGVCAAPSCTDGVTNGTETGTDCGGGSCPACGNGQGCRFNGDCTSDVCQAGTTCVAPSCNDGILDGSETAVDCGGTLCPACGNGLACVMASDCTSTMCISGVCGQCAVASDCPATNNECIVPTCAANTCGTSDLGASHALSTGQTAGDCQQVVCDGSGGTKPVDDPTDLPTATSACQVPQCTGTPLKPTFGDAVLGSDCTSDAMPPAQVCNATGTCVECNAAADCTTPTNVCLIATCTANQCGTADAPVGTDCTAQGPSPAHVCGDPALPSGGTCVQCNVLADCPALSVSCTGNLCL